MMNDQTKEHLDETFAAANKHQSAELYNERISYCQGMIAALRIEHVISQDEADMWFARFRANTLRRHAEQIRTVRLAQS